MKNEKIKSLKSYHATLAGLSAMGLLAVIFIDNWGDMIMWLPMAVAIFCDGKYEKRDELARLNLYKANTVTMWILFIVLGWFGMYARFHAVPVSHIVGAACAVIAIRSLLFLFFDRSTKAEDADA